jgi:polar amino acid transport system substrate-binding protein
MRRARYGFRCRISRRINLANRRVDAVFLAELAFVKAAEKSGIAGSQYTTIVQETKPFGLYLSKKYLSENPGIMKRIHAAIRSLKP